MANKEQRKSAYELSQKLRSNTASVRSALIEYFDVVSNGYNPETEVKSKPETKSKTDENQEDS